MPRLAEQLRAFSTVTQERKAEILAEAGNVIAREENERRKRQLEEAQMLFDIEADRRGEVADILNSYAEKIANNPRRKRDLIEEAWEVVSEKLGLERPATPKQEEPSLFGFSV